MPALRTPCSESSLARNRDMVVCMPSSNEPVRAQDSSRPFIPFLDGLSRALGHYHHQNNGVRVVVGIHDEVYS